MGLASKIPLLPLLAIFLVLGILFIVIAPRLFANEGIYASNVDSNSKIPGTSSDVFTRYYHSHHTSGGYPVGYNAQMPTSPSGRNP